MAASVSIPTLQIGAYSGEDGRFTFTVPAGKASGQVTLTARRVGYQPRSVTIELAPGKQIEQDLTLAAAPTQLEGVVVSALGLQKEKTQLGTAQQQLNTEELNTTQDPNVLNQLSGKVSGIQITGSGTQGGSTRIVIRGQSSLAGNNQPLIVVDGIPIFNDDRGGHPGGGGSQDGGIDFGSTIGDINPSDIASLTVLKGPNAAAIYGSRAANGAIIITTKGGKATDNKIATDFTTSMTWENPSRLPDYQNLYGQGAAGQFKFVNGAGKGIQDGNDQSFGPRLDGQPRDQFTGKDMPWVAHPNNVKDFFNTGRTITSNLGVSGGTERTNARLSVGSQTVDGVVPNSSWNKLSGALAGQLKVGDRLTTSANISYIRNQGRNRPGVGYNTGILEQFIWFGRQVDINALRNYWDKDGNQFNWNYNYHNNPFWIQYENPESDQRNNLIVSATAQYQLTDWLNATLRSGTNSYNFSANQNYAAGNLNFGNPGYNGAFNQFQNQNTQNNTEFFVSANKGLTSRFTVNALVGANRRYEEYSSTNLYVDGIAIPKVYNVLNAAIAPTNAQFHSRRQVNSLYGTASFTFDDWWTVEGTARNDWSSTLPKGNNSYFYPSVNTSVVLTNALPSLKSDVLTYVKLRGSVARVGNDAEPYKLVDVYNGFSARFGSLQQFTRDTNIANPNLKPELTTAAEGGVELGFFNDRLTIDATYYTKTTKNQIINLTLSPTSGYKTKAINAGEIQNHGFEALVSATPVRTESGFQWTTTFNFAANRSKVVDLYGDLSTVVLGTTWAANVEARKGGPFGVIYGFPFARDEETGELLTDGGYTYAADDRTVLGKVEPDWVGGWNNDFRYNRFSFGVLLDMRKGGSIYSVSNMFGEYAGVFANSLKGREVDWDNPGVVVKGIDVNTGLPNTTRITAEDYYQNLFQLHEAYVYDASWLKLREVRIGYDLPESLLSRLHASAVNVSLVGRNLWMSTKVPNIDPEFAYSTGNFQGMEFAALPNARSLGFNVRITP
jgi:TonB-linked SusC/RagA family outer membrane protein